MQYLFRACLPLIIVLISSCVTSGHQSRVKKAEFIAEEAGLKKTIFHAGAFKLLGFQKNANKSSALTVYIEGDGRAWITRWRPSKNPTPINPIGLKLAAADKHSRNIIYIARPCQYINLEESECDSNFWLNGRYSQNVIDAYIEIIDQIQQAGQYTKINVVGFSGGGAVALLIAAQREDIDLVVTVAGNIDTNAFVKFHRISPMEGSLNPAEFAERLTDIPQIHLYGEDDKIVPPLVSESYIKMLPDNHRAKRIMVKDVGHNNRWVEWWGVFSRKYMPSI